MSRVTNGPASRQRRKKRLKLARGFYGARHRCFRMATESVDRAMVMAFEHRKKKKQQYRSTWIVRVTAACKERGITYSRLVEALSKAGISLNRKMLSEIAIYDAAGFDQIVEKAGLKITRA